MAQSTSPSTAQTQRTTVDYETVKSRQQAMWASGDFGVVGATLQLVGETLCEALDLDAGTEVLDVACGNGNATLAAARRFCRVTGLDYVPSLLHQTADRARSEHLSVRLVEGDAERLPFAKSQFDAALSTFGVMFAPNQDQAASELVRVVRPGGRIGLANWTPEGFVGQLLRTVGKHVPPPPGVPSPAFWGVEARLRDLFPRVRSLRALRRDFLFRYESTDHFIDVFRRFYGPTYKAFRALDLDGQARLAADITELATKFNRKPSTYVVPGEYLEVIIER
jgi:ubiquinone/menaquinone biosynthesis C-methylase UbiE